MKTFIKSIKIIAVALVIGWGVSGVSAFTPGAFPDGQVPAVFNTGAENQIKQGGLLSEKFMVSDLAFFTKTLLPGKDSWLNIGSRLNVAPGAINNNGSTIPLTVDLKGRANVTKDGTVGQNAINFISGQTSCSTATAFINDRASAFEFTSSGTDTGHADLIARQLQLSGGSPQDGSVLAAVDTDGNAVWAHLAVQGGVLKVINNQTGSPVVTDANCNPTPTYHWEFAWSACRQMNDGGGADQQFADRLYCKNSSNTMVALSLCDSVNPGLGITITRTPTPSGATLYGAWRVADSSLPICQYTPSTGNTDPRQFRCHMGQWNEQQPVTSCSNGNPASPTGDGTYQEGTIFCTFDGSTPNATCKYVDNNTPPGGN